MKSIKRLLIGIFLLLVGIGLFGFGLTFGMPGTNGAGMIVFGLGLIYGIFGIFTNN